MSKGYDVTYCRNFTDVDDKIIKRSSETGVSPEDLTNRFIAEFHKDVKSLYCLPPSVEPKVTESIPSIVAMIGTIIDNGHAYAVDGDVYFNVPSLSEYGVLSGRNTEDNRAGERVSVDNRKKHPADFALWKAAKEGEISWESPWGPGRPGWHIECSAMSADVLGPVVDIHGGGADLVFPHHENELAQSKAACSHSTVRYWMHNGFVTIDEEKMSKSLGNFFTIREVLEVYHPIALRFLLLNTQYRAPINYSQRGLEEASDRIYYLYQTWQDATAILEDAASEEEPLTKDVQEAWAAVDGAMADDLNTPVVLATLSVPLKGMNDLLNTKAGRKAKDRQPRLRSYAALLNHVFKLMGLPGVNRASDVLSGLRCAALKRAGLTEEDVAQCIEDRKVARANKEYDAADEVRKSLEAKGITLMDTPKGTTWRPTPVIN